MYWGSWGRSARAMLPRCPPRDAGHSQGGCWDCCLVMTRTGARSGWTRGQGDWNHMGGWWWGQREGGKRGGRREKEKESEER